MGAPDGERAGIVRSKRLRIGQRGDGAAGQARVEPFQRLIPRGPAKLADTAIKRPEKAREDGQRADPQNLDRQPVMQPESERRDALMRGREFMAIPWRSRGRRSIWDAACAR